MKYIPDGDADCASIRSKRLCFKCIHYKFCTRQKDTLQDQQRVLKSEPLEPWVSPGEGAKTKKKLGGAEF